MSGNFDLTTLGTSLPAQLEAMAEVEATAKTVQLETPAAGATVQFNDGTKTLVIQGTATLATLTINMPVNPAAQPEVEIIFQVAVTALTINPGAGTTMLAAPTAAIVGQHNNFTDVENVWS